MGESSFELDEKERVHVADTDLKDWDTIQCLHWILSVRNGIFQPYEDALIRSMVTRGVKGMDLIAYDMTDLESLGIETESHRKLLKTHIVQKSMVFGTNVNGETQDAIIQMQQIYDNYVMVMNQIKNRALSVSDSGEGLNPRSEGSEHSGNAEEMYVE
eukprot:345968_1